MLTYSKTKKFKLTLKAIYKDDATSEFVVKNHLKSTLISEDKTVYLYFKNTSCSLCAIKKGLAKFIKCNLYDINIDFDSFKVAKDIKKEKVFQTICNTVSYQNHQFKTYKTTKAKPIINYHIVSNGFEKDQELFHALEIVNYYRNLARDLQNMPPNKLKPIDFAEIIKKEVKKISNNNLKLTILDQEKIKHYKMNLLLAVNAGSIQNASVVVLEYRNNKSEIAKKNYAFVGKGITFDTGGICLKTPLNIRGMKYDMSGAAIACLSVLAAAKLNIKANLIGIGCLTENQIGSSATIPESVVTSMNGKTVAINNTDAEGRLAVSDGITFAINKLKATNIVELSTLTGAMLIALGQYLTGVFATEDNWYQSFKKAACLAGEEIWRMPIHNVNIQNMKRSRVADLTNVANTRFGGSSNAAAFLSQFAQKRPFIHLDIAGTATEDFHDDSGTGVMVHTLVALAMLQSKK